MRDNITNEIVGKVITNPYIRDIMVFKKDKFICWIRADIIPKEYAIMQLIEVTIDGKNIHVLYFFDMDYGIVVPAKVAQQVHDVVDGPDNYGEKIEDDRPITFEKFLTIANTLKKGETIYTILYQGKSEDIARGNYNYINRLYTDKEPMPINGLDIKVLIEEIINMNKPNIGDMSTTYRIEFRGVIV